jgi:DNA-binding NarL/FixJ family response regulator
MTCDRLPPDDPDTLDAPSEARIAVFGSDRLTMDAVAALIDSEFASGDGSSCLVSDAASADIVLLVLPDPQAWEQLEPAGAPAVVVLPAEPTAEDLIALAQKGAVGCVSLDDPEHVLVETMRRVLSGEAGLSGSQTRLLMGAVARHSATDVRPVLTAREVDILEAINSGKSIQQTAAVLGVSPRTVENTQRFLFQKLRVANRVQAIAKGYELGLLTRQPR